MMVEHQHRATESLIKRHFGGRISAQGERDMREALSNCTECHDYYERHMVLARLDPRGLDARTRLARGLGIGRNRFWRGGFFGVAALTAVATAALLIVPRIAHDSSLKSSSEFGVRGSAQPADRLFIHRLSKGQAPERLGRTMAADDELAFSYQNPSSFSHLLVFAVDPEKQVYWYHPAWTDPNQQPTAISISPGPETRELPEAVRHNLHPGRLRLFGVFANRPLSVEEIERAVSAARVDDDRLPIPDTVQIVEMTEVVP